MTVRELIDHLAVMDEAAEVHVLVTPDNDYTYKPLVALVMEDNGIYLIGDQTFTPSLVPPNRWQCGACNGHISHGPNKPEIPCFRCGKKEWVPA